MVIKMLNNELCHHGVKGQKWGDRNGPPYPLSPENHSANEKKENWQYSLKNSNSKKSTLAKVSDYSASAGRLSLTGKRKSGNKNSASHKTTSPLQERFASPFKKAGIMASNGIHTSDIKGRKLFTTRSLSDKGITIKKGEKVQHVMSTEKKDMSNRDYLFVAATEADKKNYGGYFAALTKYRNQADQMYKMELTAMNDLVSPSKKERVNTFMEIYKENPTKVARQLAEFNKRNYGDQYKESVEQLTKKYSKMSTRQLKKMGYYTYANSWFDPEAGTLRDMRSKLEKKGYNAIIDDNDKRSFMQSEAPLIVFDVMNNLGNEKVSKLTNGEMRRNMIDWQHMKHSEGENNMYYDELYHHGVKGQKWGVRRYQNSDGSLTPEGEQRYSSEKKGNFKKYAKTGAKIAAGILVAYGVHKVINDPRALEAGKVAISKMKGNTEIFGKAASSVASTTEYKLAKSAVGATKKGLSVIGNDKTTNALKGIGTMAITASAARQTYGEIKELKNKDMDKFDKASTYVEKMSDLSVDVSYLSKGANRQNGNPNKKNNSGNSNTSNNSNDKGIKDKVGEPKGFDMDRDGDAYQELFKRDPSPEQRNEIKRMRKSGYSVDQIEKYIYHSGISNSGVVLESLINKFSEIELE